MNLRKTAALLLSLIMCFSLIVPVGTALPKGPPPLPITQSAAKICLLLPADCTT